MSDHKITDIDEKLLKEKYANNFNKVLSKIKNGYPVQYLIGYVDFYGYRINVDNSVLIPRFETEQLVERTIKYIKREGFIEGNVLDLCTGSGCIAIALKKEIPTLNVIGIDYSQKALANAKKNALQNDANILLFNQDVLRSNLTGNYDVIISNPPYISIKEPVDIQTKYEPQDAIFAGNDGLDFYYKIAEKSKKILNKKGIIALEIGYNQGKSVSQIFRTYYPKSKIVIEKDYNNFDRFVFIFNNFE